MLLQPKSFFSNRYVLFIFIVTAIHAAFFIYALNSRNIYLSVDSTEYLNQAKNFAEHTSWYAGDWNKPHDMFLETRRPPLYAMFIYVLRFFSESDFFVLLAQNVLSIAGLLIAFKTAGKISSRILSPVVMAGLLLFFPTQFIYANMIMADVLFQFLLVLAVYFFVLFLKEHKANYFLCFNLLITLAVLTKPVLYWFWGLVMLMSLLMWSKSRLSVLQLSFVLLPLIAVLLLSWYNYNKTGYFHYSSVNQKFISEYGAYLAVGDRGDLIAQQKVDSILLVAKQQPTYKEYATYLNRESMALIKNNFANFTWMQTKGIVSFFTDHGRWDLFAFFVQPDYNQQQGIKFFYTTKGLAGVAEYIKTFNPFLIVYLLLTMAVNIFLLFGFVKFISDRKINIWLRVLLVCLVLYMVVFTGVVGCSRYRMAVYPFLLMGAMVAFGNVKITRPAIEK